MYPICRRGERLELRELRAEDADAVFAIYGDPLATEHLSFEPRSRDDVTAIVARSLASAGAEPRQEYALAVAERDGGRLIGFGRLALDPHQPRGATFGFALRPDAWGVGYGLETVRLLLSCGFDDLGLHRVWGGRGPHSTRHRRAPWHGPGSWRRARSANTSSGAGCGATRWCTRSSTANGQRGPDLSGRVRQGLVRDQLGDIRTATCVRQDPEP